jgi:hypothetical protein
MITPMGCRGKRPAAAPIRAPIAAPAALGIWNGSTDERITMATWLKDHARSLIGASVGATAGALFALYIGCHGT